MLFQICVWVFLPLLLFSNTRYDQRLQRCSTSPCKNPCMFWGTSCHLNLGITWNFHVVLVTQHIHSGFNWKESHWGHFQMLGFHPCTPVKEKPGEINQKTAQFSTTLTLKQQIWPSVWRLVVLCWAYQMLEVNENMVAVRDNEFLTSGDNQAWSEFWNWQNCIF